MTLCACRLQGHRRGIPLVATAVRTPDWRSLCRWITRTRGSRKHAPHTLWIEEEDRPAVLIRVKR